MDIVTLISRASELGYTVVYDGTEIQYVMPTDRNNYTPEIFSSRDGNRRTWGIQTTGYGSKTSEEIDQIIAGFQRAQKMTLLLECWA